MAYRLRLLHKFGASLLDPRYIDSSEFLLQSKDFSYADGLLTGYNTGGQMTVTYSMITSIVQTIKTRFARVTLRVAWWTITISI
jgi:hypothetical protein